MSPLDGSGGRHLACLKDLDGVSRSDVLVEVCSVFWSEDGMLELDLKLEMLSR